MKNKCTGLQNYDNKHSNLKVEAIDMISASLISSVRSKSSEQNTGRLLKNVPLKSSTGYQTWPRGCAEFLGYRGTDLPE
ncbi:hypothetical protein K1719_017469 [Acacia pycnantha]|nr:hypothetical protein K1719_017469 [Acacia pycnantha]